MSDSKPAQFYVGANGDYRWIVANRTLGELLDAVPQFVVGKHIAVTSSDSGPFQPSEQEKVKGWVSRSGIAYSPRVETVKDLPCDRFDELYIYREPAALGERVGPEVSLWESEITPGRVHVFVNYSFNFSLHLPEFSALTEIFWEQLNLLQPESFLADGDQLTVVTRDRNLAEAFVRALRRA